MSELVRFLMIDTCGTVGRVALAAGDAVVSEAEMPGRTYSERLVGEGMRLLEGVGWSLGELSAVVVVTGPGSFTGVRVGVSAAKGWAEAAGAPVIALSRLELLAATSDATDVLAVLDAGRGEFYCGEYFSGVCGFEALLTREQMPGAARGKTAIAFEKAVLDAVVVDGWGVISAAREPGAGEMLRLARARFAAGMFDDVATLDANYVRRSDAEIFAWGKAASQKADGLQGSER